MRHVGSSLTHLVWLLIVESITLLDHHSDSFSLRIFFFYLRSLLVSIDENANLRATVLSEIEQKADIEFGFTLFDTFSFLANGVLVLLLRKSYLLLALSLLNSTYIIYIYIYVYILQYYIHNTIRV